MKKLFLGLGLAALLAGCASHQNDNGMGGTSDQYNQSESSGQFHNNATKGTGATDLTSSNNATGQGMQQ